ncbi:MAG: MFS transporter [Hydrogenibacillus sp.]|nr:MFS transporter [Hydrogenibacillus sp.]
MRTAADGQSRVIRTEKRENTTYLLILIFISLAHLFNDAMQAVVPAIFPILRDTLALDYVQLGWISFTLNATSSLLQPVIGFGTDRRPLVYLLPAGMLLSLAGMIALGLSPGFHHVLLAVFLVGLGSAVFHPEASRVAYLAGGARRGLGQSIFQVGGNTGQSLAPLFTALIFVPFGQRAALTFALPAATAAGLMLYIAAWRKQMASVDRTASAVRMIAHDTSRRTSIVRARTTALIVLVAFVFVRSWYSVGMSNFYAFYLIHHYGFTIKTAQLYLFLFLAAGALGTFLGGPMADRFGQKTVIVASMLGAAPIALLLPYVGPTPALILVALLGFIILSSYSVTVIYAQELFPGHVGAMSGLVIGLAFGMGAIGAIAVGTFIEHFGIDPAMRVLSALPLVGAIALFLPGDRRVAEWQVTGRKRHTLEK